MSQDDPYFEGISDPLKRKRAISDRATTLINELLASPCQESGALSEKLEYIRNAFSLVSEIKPQGVENV